MSIGRRVRGRPVAKVPQEGRKRLLARAEEDRVGMGGGFVRQRRHVQAAEGDEDAPRAIVVGEPIGAVRVGDVDLDHARGRAGRRR